MERMREKPALTQLVIALEQATLMAKQLPEASNPSQILQIYSTLHSAHFHLSSFLSQTTLPPLPQPSLLFPSPPAAENSASSAFANDNDFDEPMQVGDGDEDVELEKSTKTTIIEEGMRDCFIQNKRPKRPLSPSAAAAAEQRRAGEDGFVRSAVEFDPHGTRLRALDLIYQFHG